MQERIVRSLLGGRDTCVVMPTGGGKSLCYQLPAAMLAGKTAVVISPLIALMQDQVAQLAQMGIAAALLNSSLDRRQQSARDPRSARGEIPAAVCFARAAGARQTRSTGLQRVPISLLRHRRSALHFRMGPRVPARVPAAEPPARSISRTARSRRSRPAPRGACATTSSTSSSCAIRTNTSPASIARICATS